MRRGLGRARTRRAPARPPGGGLGARLRSTRRPWPRCWTRCGPGPAMPTSSTTCCSRWSLLPAGPRVAALVRRARAPTAGPAWSADAGWPPSAGRWPRARPLAERPTAGTTPAGRVRGRPSRPGRPGDRRAAGGRRAAPRRLAPWGAADRGPGPHGLARLEAPGSAIDLPDGRWCARHLLVRLHAASRSRRRRHGRAGQPRRVRALPRLLAARGRRAPRPRVGPGLLAVIEQLQGLEVAAGEWERTVLPARVAGYDPRWLDELCLAGEVAWGRLTPRPDGTPADEPVAPEALASTAHPAAGVGARPRLPRPRRWPSSQDPTSRGCWPPSGPTGRSSNRPPVPRPTSSAALRSAGGLLPIRAGLGRRPAGDRGRRRALGPGGPGHRHRRRLLGGALPPLGPPTPAGHAPGTARRSALGRRRALVGTGVGEGRWSLLPEPDVTGTRAARTGRRRRSWPRRWPGSCWPAGASWPGSCGRGSRSGSPGGRWCGPCAGWRPAARSSAGGSWPGSRASSTPRPRRHRLLADVRRDPGRGAVVEVAGADPLNLTGAMLGGARIPSIRDRTVHYRGGVPVASEEVVPTG